MRSLWQVVAPFVACARVLNSDVNQVDPILRTFLIRSTAFYDALNVHFVHRDRIALSATLKARFWRAASENNIPIGAPKCNDTDHSMIIWTRAQRLKAGLTDIVVPGRLNPSR